MKRISFDVSEDTAKVIIPLISDYVSELHMISIGGSEPSKRPHNTKHVVTIRNRGIQAMLDIAAANNGTVTIKALKDRCEEIGLKAHSSYPSIALRAGFFERGGEGVWVLTGKGRNEASALAALRRRIGSQSDNSVMANGAGA